ncbi:NUDIX domain containing protein [Novymonas esmeraldas]|uniref:NUDIX domain containing protein n=1 Tax=Novymonas esmeraldas TaxID=1808958 RepID=A0AAW0FA46_9TRYP
MSAPLKAAVPRLASTVLLLARNTQHVESSSSPPLVTATGVSRANDIHVLMMKRHGKARFMPSVYVFPGGGVEGADQVFAQHYLAEHHQVGQSTSTASPSQDFLEARLQPSAEEAEVEAWACRAAALRELAEETACVLQKDGSLCSAAQWTEWQRQRRATRAAPAEDARDGAVGGAASPIPIYDVSAAPTLRPVARWVTPRQFKYRYDTYFYAALVDSAVTRDDREPGTTTAHAAATRARRCAPQELPLLMQASEVAELLWVSPLDALRRHEDASDTFSLAPPTYLLLHALSLQTSFESLAAAWSASPPVAAAEAQPLGTLPYSSVLPCVEPCNTLSADGLHIVDFVLPSRFFHEEGWSLADGEYLFLGESYAEQKHYIHARVGSAATTTSATVHTIHH